MAKGEIAPSNVMGTMNRISTAMKDPAMMPTLNASNALAADLRTGPATYGTSATVKAPHARMRYMAPGVGLLSAHLPPRKYPSVR